jgi:hypothetical protein
VGSTPASALPPTLREPPAPAGPERVPMPARA